MLNLKTISVIIVVAVVFGALMSYRVGMQSTWGRALIAALAFGVLGVLLSSLVARRK